MVFWWSRTPLMRINPVYARTRRTGPGTAKAGCKQDILENGILSGNQRPIWLEERVFGDANFTSAMQPPDGEVENYCSSIAFDGPEGYDRRIFIGVRDDAVPHCMHAATARG